MVIFPFYHSILLGTINTRWFINDPMLLKEWREDLIKIIFCIIGSKFFNSRSKLSGHYWKIFERRLRFDLFFKRKTHVIRVQHNKPTSSRNVGYSGTPNVTMNKSEWNICSFITYRKTARLCFTSSHTSQWKLLTTIFLSNEENKILRTWNDGWPKRR